MSRKQLTSRQQDYANAIVDAGLAAREEVENAFRERTSENEDKIAVWGRALTQKRKETQQAALKRQRREEVCAYPGCMNIIEVGRTSLYEPEMPEPTRTVTIIMQMEGWHWQGYSKEPNTMKKQVQFYGCSPEHQEGIFHLDFALVPSLLEREHQLHIQYPMSDETQWKVYELAKARAQELVAQAKELADLPQIRRTITHLAQQEVEALIAASDPAWLTDNLDQFQAVYIQEFVGGFLEGLRSRRKRPQEKGRRRW